MLHMSLESLLETMKALVRIEDRLEEYKSVERNFKHGPFDIRNDFGFKPEEYQRPLDTLDKASAAIKAAGYGKVLYGTVILAGHKTNSHLSYAGLYKKDGDLVYLNVESKYRFNDIYTLIHEFGHRYWHQFMTETQRDSYETLYSGTSNPLTVADRELMWEALLRSEFDVRKAKGFLPEQLRETFSAYWKQHIRVTLKPTPMEYQRSPKSLHDMFVRPRVKFFHFDDDRPTSVTDYGRTNVKEDFAEVFAHVITGQNLTPDAEARFNLAQ